MKFIKYCLLFLAIACQRLPAQETSSCHQILTYFENRLPLYEISSFDNFKAEGFRPRQLNLGENSIPNYLKYDVKYIPQNDSYSCATTSLAMAISYYKKSLLDKDQVWKISGSSKTAIFEYGNDMDGLKRITNYYGYNGSFIEQMSIDELEFLLSLKALVVLNIQNLPSSSDPFHSVLVIGYDKKKQLFFINDPSNPENIELKYSDLNSRWVAYLSFPRGLYYKSGFVVFPDETIPLFS